MYHVLIWSKKKLSLLGVVLVRLSVALPPNTRHNSSAYPYLVGLFSEFKPLAASEYNILIND